MSEQVLVFHQEEFDCSSEVIGLNNDPHVINRWYRNVFKKDKLFFVERATAEQDETIKQVIPYVVLMNADNHVLTYSRTKKGGDSRLHSKFSIGFGGHINPHDGEDNILVAAILRELEEELVLDDTLREDIETDVLHPSALIYDNSNEVGRVHFGLVYVIDTCYDEQTVLTNDQSISTPTFKSLKGIKDDIKSKRTEFENWSKLIIEAKILE